MKIGEGLKKNTASVLFSELGDETPNQMLSSVWLGVSPSHLQHNKKVVLLHRMD